MKSASFDLNQTPIDKGKLNKTFDFANLYKSESKRGTFIAETLTPDDPRIRDCSASKHEDSKRERSPNKNRKKRKNVALDISCISFGVSVLNSSVGPSTPRIEGRPISTPITLVKTASRISERKSIMKFTVVDRDDNMDGTKTIINKPKKRNKSVSFMLDDNDEMVVKRTKSEDSISKKKDDKDTRSKSTKEKKKQLKNLRKECIIAKEIKIGDINYKVEKIKEKIRKKKGQTETPLDPAVSTVEGETQEKKRKVKKSKKNKKEVEDSTQSTTDAEKPPEPKKKKPKTITLQINCVLKPVTPAQNNDIKPDVIAEDLENLSIGDNAHSLSNLLDEMTVADKSKQIKKKSKAKDSRKTPNSNVMKSETLASEDEREKVKWKKRRWNKDKKGDVDMDNLATSVIIENIPIAVMLTYKKILADQFGDCGLIKNIGVAEMYPTVEATPYFTTTINFYSDGAATKALEKDNMLLEGSQIRVKRPLPATETTLVLRTYGELTEQLVCSMLAGAGKIRNIRHVVKGKKATSTAFVEMDGPESVEKALKLATGVKLGGKKIHVNRFELRSHKKIKNEETKTDDKDNDGPNE